MDTTSLREKGQPQDKKKKCKKRETPEIHLYFEPSILIAYIVRIEERKHHSKCSDCIDFPGLVDKRHVRRFGNVASGAKRSAAPKQTFWARKREWDK